MKQTAQVIRYQQHKYLSHQISTKQTPQSSDINNQNLTSSDINAVGMKEDRFLAKTY